MNVTDTLDVLVNFPMSESIMLTGNHGIGKSRIVQKAAQIMGVPCIDFRLSQNDVGDLKGMPFRVGLNTVFAPPEFYPITLEDAKSLAEAIGVAAEEVKAGRYGDKGILFLDEINRANREVQQAAFELVLDKRLNLRPLPEGWRVVTAINDEDDIYTVNSIDPAFLSRFFLVKFDPTYEDWMKWAQDPADGNIHPAIVEFLRRYPDFLDPTRELLSENAAKGVSKVHDRRAWEKFSRTIEKLEADKEAGNRDLDPLDKSAKSLNFMTQVAQGYVGHLASVKFRSFIQTDYKALDGNAILNKWDATVEKQLKSICTAKRIPELSAYNESILVYCEKKVKEKLNTTQKDNLAKYLKMIPNEVVADFWQKFNKEHKVASEDWFKDPKINGKTIVLGALVCPDAVKKMKAKS
jgi:hypothetical protein